MAYKYDPSRAALLTPARGAVFFEAGRPPTEAALCAEMSRLTYAPFESDQEAKCKVEEALKRVGFSICYFICAGGTQGFLTADTESSLSILAFRGTEVNRVDRATDLQAWPRAWAEGGRVHQGFAAALALVWDDLAPRLADAKGRRIYTGHSLGAALATLAASRQPPDALYTYGSPRVGDDAFLQTLSSIESHRYTNCCDVICRLPMELLGYRHLGFALYVDREGAVRPARDYRGARLDRLRARLSYLGRWSWRRGTLWTRDFADHSPVNYFSALSRMR
jgi:triacylglycerol lipase